MGIEAVADAKDNVDCVEGAIGLKSVGDANVDKGDGAAAAWGDPVGKLPAVMLVSKVPMDGKEEAATAFAVADAVATVVFNRVLANGVIMEEATVFAVADAVATVGFSRVLVDGVILEEATVFAVATVKLSSVDAVLPEAPLVDIPKNDASSSPALDNGVINSDIF